MKRLLNSILTGLAAGAAIVAAQEIIWRRFPRDGTAAEVRAKEHYELARESVRQSQWQTQIMREAVTELVEQKRVSKEIVDAILFAVEKKKEEKDS